MEGNFHNIGGKKYARVTSILNIIHSDELEKIQRFRGFRYVDEIRDKKADFGKRFHNICEEFARGRIKQAALNMINDKQPDIYKRLLNFSWVIQPNIKKILMTEKKLADKEMEYSGTMDFVYQRKDGKTVLSDIKTGLEQSTHKLQMSAYKNLVEKNTKLKIDECELWYLSEKKAKIVKINNMEIKKYFMLFICALNLYKEFSK